MIVLGSTGSIGVSTLRVIEHLNRTTRHRFRVLGLAANQSCDALEEQVARFDVRHVALCDRAAAARFRGARRDLTIYDGPHAAESLVRDLAACNSFDADAQPGLDLVVGAIVGAAGIRASLAALELGVDLALANKETLVAAGSLVVAAARRTGARILPIDSEHSAIWQALAAAATSAPPVPVSREFVPPCDLTQHVRRIILTASGGPLRTATLDELRSATPGRVLDHPTWNMGPKITVDSASLTNKALEIIEGHFLFGLPGSQIDAVIHPQSIVHSLVEYHDGSQLAQLGAPDMTAPIQYALTHPDRPASLAPRLDLARAGRLDFAAPDLERFPALGLAYDVLEAAGTTAGAVFNAANEAAVEAFLAERIRFGEITHLAAEALSAVEAKPLTTLDDVFTADAEARDFVARTLGTHAGASSERGSPGD